MNDGLYVQMLHVESYDDETSSFDMMKEYCKKNNLKRLTEIDREIYEYQDFKWLKKWQACKS